MPPRRPLLSAVCAVTGAVALALGSDVAPAVAGPPPGRPDPGQHVTVMTRNVYLGGDITRPLVAATAPPAAALAVLADANHELRAIVDRTDFPARSKLLAKEIAATDPDLVGLQEVALWRSGPLELPPSPTDLGNLGVSNAEQVDLDFLQLLRRELARLGEPYLAVSVQEESDVEGPAFPGGDPTAPTARDVRLTMRDVVLKRATSAVRVEATGSSQYDTRLPFGIGPVQYSFIRGYTWADVRLGPTRFRFVNTHLESQYSIVAYGQAQELLAEAVAPAAEKGRSVIVVCDCNSDPLDSSQKTLPGGALDLPHDAPYRLLRGALDDAWLRTGTSDPGFTSGLNETLDEPPPASFTHRIDLVLTRGAGGTVMPADSPVLVGTDPANRSAAGLWPSDHAGVVVRLQP